MLIARLHQFLTAPAVKPNSSRVVFWFSLTMTFAAVYGILCMQRAFSSEYVAQDDARMYAFWMQQFVDPDLMPHDLNVDYHKSISPPGYTLLYWLMAKVGVEPLLFSKLLPIVLGLVATAYSFGVCLQILPVPSAAFTATLLINQGVWLKDDIVSATPRGFIYPLFLAFLYYLLQGSLLPVVLAIALLGLFYPPTMFISVGILIVRLWRWEKGRLRFSRDRRDYALCAWGIGAALLVMLPYALSTSEFGPAVTVAQAKTWPEYASDGRIPVFYDNPYKYWFTGIHTSLRLSFNPPLVALGLLLPFLVRYPSRFPLVQQIGEKIVILPQILLASLTLFFAAHALLFKLFLPSRYMSHSLLILIAIAGGMALIVILDAVLRACLQPLQRRWVRFLGLGATVLIGFTLILYPNIFWKDFARSGYFVGSQPVLYQFFQQQPKDILIATLSEEATNITTFAHRSVLVSRKLAIPYHAGYYLQIRQRVTDLLHAQYSPNLADVQRFIQKYKVDFWLVEQAAFTQPYLENRWFKMFEPARSEAVANLERGTTPALASMVKSCSVLESGGLVVLPAKCITKAANAALP